LLPLCLFFAKERDKLQHRIKALSTSLPGSAADFHTLSAGVSVNVIYTDFFPALIGFCLFLGGYPLYVLMRKLYPEKEVEEANPVNGK
jgi:hypothetical protein